jgi:HEAT repeat protein
MGTDVADILEILQSTQKPKEKMAAVAELFRTDKTAITRFMKQSESLTVSERGNCFSALTILSKEKPKDLKACLEFVIAHVNDKAPRVKWEASEILGHAAAEFPEVAAEAIPKLLKNLDDEGTVVKWSAAFALTEIAKANPKIRPKLIPLFESGVANEDNNAVRKMYEKTLKALRKAEKA